MADTLTDLEKNRITRLAEMLDHLNDELVRLGFTDGNVIADVMVKATPQLAERAFDGN